MKCFLLPLLFFFIFTLLFSCNQMEGKTYDLVIMNARVIDPETNTDEILNVGINKNKIAILSKSMLKGKTNIDGTGKVLAPGFIDLHAHGQTNIENEYQAFDGVTTALELEVGVDDLTDWYAKRAGKAFLNFGSSACQLAYRNKLIGQGKAVQGHHHNEVNNEAVNKPLSADKFAQLAALLSSAIDNGAIGIGIPVGYTPEASLEEISYVYSLAGMWQVPIFSHVREGGGIAFQQAIADAILHRAPLHICHLPSMARKDYRFCLSLLEKAQKQGFQISTELYPYTAGNTEISSAVFDAGWQERLGCSFNGLQWVETGERLTPESFEKFRLKGGSVIVHMLQEEWVRQALLAPFTMIASDGGEYAPLGHPRGSGTFTKILRKYVREDKLIDLPTAIRKMTLMPAQVIENIAPDMKKRGRIQTGCYADLVLFDPLRIQDKSTYETGFVRASGMEYVWVNGQALIAKGQWQKDVYPGRAIKGEKGVKP